ncbi:hypothetical protein DB34_07190 [Acetobacter pasteurianus]|nr:hypothetical protein DB34_07190 [Acetobacter pasteurianus]
MPASLPRETRRGKRHHTLSRAWRQIRAHALPCQSRGKSKPNLAFPPDMPRTCSLCPTHPACTSLGEKARILRCLKVLHA